MSKTPTLKHTDKYKARVPNFGKILESEYPPVESKTPTQNDSLKKRTFFYTKDDIRFYLVNLAVSIGTQVSNDYKENRGIYEGLSIKNMKLVDQYTKLFVELLADARKEHGLRYYLETVEHLEEYGRDRLMKRDERALGFYEAIKELERYFGLATLREEQV